MTLAAVPVAPAAQLLSVQQVAAKLSVSVSGVWAKAKEAARTGFPQPFKLSARQTRWVQSEVDSYIANKMATRH